MFDRLDTNKIRISKDGKIKNQEKMIWKDGKYIKYN